MQALIPENLGCFLSYEYNLPHSRRLAFLFLRIPPRGGEAALQFVSIPNTGQNPDTPAAGVSLRLHDIGYCPVASAQHELEHLLSIQRSI